VGKGTVRLPSPTFDGIVYIEDRPHARLSIVGGGSVCVQTADVDWLAELASVAKNACAALLTERARDAQALAMHINEENKGGPDETPATADQ
jgi:hypothetical protein